MGENTLFVYNVGGKMIMEFNGATGGLMKEYVPLGGSMATIAHGGKASAAVMYVTSDHLGTRVSTKADGSVAARHYRAVVLTPFRARNALPVSNLVMQVNCITISPLRRCKPDGNCYIFAPHCSFLRHRRVVAFESHAREFAPRIQLPVKFDS